MVFKTWFSGLEISTLGPGFSHSRFPRPKPENFSGCGISILGPGFHTGGFTVAFGHGHPLVLFKKRTGIDLINCFETRTGGSPSNLRTTQHLYSPSVPVLSGWGQDSPPEGYYANDLCTVWYLPLLGFSRAQNIKNANKLCPSSTLM
jgi:hypothetical protein